ncbi:conjugal transfer protein TraD [Methylobacterium sp. SyP6R]|uniref:conjugal transfer protein TraD n=1 Tax=Methylobacterium sp. SyP6R TaxID=2718876 RepID=UPI001F0239A7|nr:conjugal transfer protein TraD [Methylobacterium sp. SyP6R]MCF4130310.1 conjugal transfer protein TraD [Methylobacterium sp. SyP6R]
MPAPQAASAEATRTRLAQAQNQLQQLDARAAQEERKRDTRRKIILGGLLLEAAGKERRFAEALDELMSRIQRPHDKTAFTEWSPAKPEDRA